jgi:Desulfoferrodoxin, N-terminal domain
LTTLLDPIIIILIECTERGWSMTGQASGNLVGKRYHCETCATEVICVKAGSGQIVCHGRPMDLLAAKPLPATD